MLIKNRNLKVNKVITFDWQSLDVDGETKIFHKDVYISGLDAENDPFVVQAYDPSFPVPKEGASWILPVGGHYSLLQ